MENKAKIKNSIIYSFKIQKQKKVVHSHIFKNTLKD